MKSRFVLARSPRSAVPSSQHGATLIVGLIMLVVITLVVLNAFTLSSSNLKSVGNMQVREEAVAAANRAIENLIGTPAVFTVAPTTYSYTVNMNNDTVTPRNYAVSVAAPTCIRAVKASSSAPSDVELGEEMSAASTWNTEWDIDATVLDSASGASVRVRQGVRVLLNQPEKDISCP